MSVPRVKVFGRNREEILPKVAEVGLDIDEETPQAVISYGGDGTLLAAEQAWPGVPKIALRDSRRCHTCSHDSNEMILRHLAEGKLKRTEFIKLRATAGDKELICLNNVILHNATITSGVRYRVWIDGEPYGNDEIVGDGLVVSTPFGSAAYYRSITQSTFRVGLGIAFNNSIEPINHLVIDDRSVIRVLITRGPALLNGDQPPDQFRLGLGDETIIRRADQNAIILAFDSVRYPADRFIYFNNKRGESPPSDLAEISHLKDAKG